ncbi:MAG: NYN domain-containing protein [Limisphaerales bacterium]
MGLLRILIDGYSLLHAWPDLAPGEPRHSAEARDELINVLTQYGDGVGTPVTVIFDGAGAPNGTPKPNSTPEMEVLYSPRGKTADDLIERVTYRMVKLGEVLVVTNDHAERDLVTSFGAQAWSCEQFILDANAALSELTEAISRHNRRENRRFKNGR